MWIVVFFRVVGNMKRSALSFCCIIYLAEFFAEIALCILSWHVNYQGETSSPTVLYHGQGSWRQLKPSGWWRWHRLTEVEFKGLSWILMKPKCWKWGDGNYHFLLAHVLTQSSLELCVDVSASLWLSIEGTLKYSCLFQSFLLVSWRIA